MIKRSLTQDEIELAKTVFGNAIDYSTVTVTDGKFAFFQPKGTAMAPDGNLYMYGCYKDDYSKEDPLSRSHFIHEMTHVWQFQNKILNPVVAAAELSLKHKFNYFAAYSFHLDATKDLIDYGMEQQASIVQEYFLIVYEKFPGRTLLCENKCEDDEALKLYGKILGKFLKDPTYAKRDSFPKPFKSKSPKH